MKKGNIASIEDDDQSPQFADLPNPILEDYPDAQPPLSDLDAAVRLFRDALDRRPAPHPLRLDLIKGLTSVLVTRFSLTDRYQDLDQALLLHGEMLNVWPGASAEFGRYPQNDVCLRPQSKTTIYI